MASKYDDWLTTTPEDEEDAAEARKARREAFEQRLDDMADYVPMDQWGKG